MNSGTGQNRRNEYNPNLGRTTSQSYTQPPIQSNQTNSQSSLKNVPRGSQKNEIEL